MFINLSCWKPQPAGYDRCTVFSSVAFSSNNGSSLPQCQRVWMQAPGLPSVTDKGVVEQVSQVERVYTTYGQEAAEAANAGARVCSLPLDCLPPPFLPCCQPHIVSFAVHCLNISGTASRYSWSTDESSCGNIMLPEMPRLSSTRVANGLEWLFRALMRTLPNMGCRCYELCSLDLLNLAHSESACGGRLCRMQRDRTASQATPSLRHLQRPCRVSTWLEPCRPLPRN